MRPFIGIEGPIGVGKTTLATYLQQQLQAELMLEVFAENPFLARFYENPTCYALQTQLFFLMNRYKQYNQLAREGGIIVSDYIFAKNDLFSRYTLNAEEYELYLEISSNLAENLVQPSLVVYLTADLDVLMQRIAARGRDYEQRQAMFEYMQHLTEQYEAFFSTYQDAPVLRIDTTRMNIVEDDEARMSLIQRILADFDTWLAEQPTQVYLL